METNCKRPEENEAIRKKKCEKSEQHLCKQK